MWQEAVLQPPATPETERTATPPALVVDLDGTLVKTDVLLESLLVLLKRNPLYFFLLPLWLLKGKARFKQEVARRVQLDVSVLPYRAEMIEYLKAERKNRPLHCAGHGRRH